VTSNDTPAADTPHPADAREARRRWWALYVLCLGVLMIVLDTTIVNVALPSIRTDLRFTETSLVWVVNAYMVTFGGFLLLGGRLGDLFGHRKMFLAGVALFTAASLACGVAPTQFTLVAARAIQGVGGAVVSAVALSLIMMMFTDAGERARAMGVYGFVCAGGGSVGVLLGGVLTTLLNWRWIFLVNLPIGLLVAVLCRALIAPGQRDTARRLDGAGALLVTLALLVAVYAVVNANEAGWTSAVTFGWLGTAAALGAMFIVVERRVAQPLMPLALFAHRNVAVANVSGVLWAAAMFAWFFMSALYLQLVLGYTPMQVGLSFLPGNLIMAFMSLGASARIVVRWGIRGPFAAGLLIAASGLALFARAPVGGAFLVDVFPAMVLLGIGAGIAFNPMLLAAMNDVAPEDAGLASGVVNTSFMMGGALGLAVLASVAAARTARVQAAGAAEAIALNAGYQAAFLLGALFAAGVALLGWLALRTGELGNVEAKVESA
jgi:EmrB/QacA subfamily drug resistance transporter